MQSHQLQKLRIIVFGSLGWMKVGASIEWMKVGVSIEHGTLREVLSVKTRQGG